MNATRMEATSTTAAACNHTLCHTDPAGSWRSVPGKAGGRKIVCKVCGTFYGYLALGQILANLIRICGERGVTPVLIHHFKRTRSTSDPYAPGELLDLTQAGAAEIAGQWLLLTRREPFDPDQAGEHRLWLSAGGRVGHSSLHAVDLHEGRLCDPCGRKWEIDIRPATEARQDADARREEAKRRRAEERTAAALDSDRKELVTILATAAQPQTKTEIRTRATFGYGRFNCAFASLVQDGTIEPKELTKGKGQHVYQGWTLRTEGQT